jgi:integrase
LHGLRHTMGDKLAERGAPLNWVASVLGHSSIATAAHYTKGADRKLMARQAMALMKSTKGDQTGNEVVSVEDPPQTLRAKKA